MPDDDELPEDEVAPEDDGGVMPPELPVVPPEDIPGGIIPPELPVVPPDDEPGGAMFPPDARPAAPPPWQLVQVWPEEMDG